MARLAALAPPPGPKPPKKGRGHSFMDVPSAPTKSGNGRLTHPKALGFYFGPPVLTRINTIRLMDRIGHQFWLTPVVAEKIRDPRSNSILGQIDSGRSKHASRYNTRRRARMCGACLAPVARMVSWFLAARARGSRMLPWQHFVH